MVAPSAKGERLMWSSPSFVSYLWAIAMDFIENLSFFGLCSDAEHNSTVHVDAGRTYELFDGNITSVDAKRLRLRGSVAPAEVHL